MKYFIDYNQCLEEIKILNSDVLKVKKEKYYFILKKMIFE